MIQVILKRPEGMTQKDWKEYKRFENMGIKKRLQRGAPNQLPMNEEDHEKLYEQAVRRLHLFGSLTQALK